MNSAAWLRIATKQLKVAGIATARLDCLVLLEEVLHTDRTQILAHPELELTDENITILSIVIEKRAQHIPLAYIRGKTEFYGREFAINEDVLEPRPESETMINLLKQLAQTDSPRTIIDVGTGSGALAISAKLELPSMQVVAIDIDEQCLGVSRLNARKLSADIQFVAGNLLQPIAESKFDQPTALLCNLPYVPDNFQINTAALHEPSLAIFGGPDGLDLYRTLFSQTVELSHKPRFILTEAMPPQHDELSQVGSAHGYDCVRTDDFIQLFVAR